MSVLVITKSTGEALTTVMRDPIEAKVEFGGHDRQLEWLPAVDASKPGMKLEWEDSCIMRYMYSSNSCVYNNYRIVGNFRPAQIFGLFVCIPSWMKIL